MAYTSVWSNLTPTGAEAANTIDDILRSIKVDISERFDDIFAMPTFVTDPLRPYGLKFTDAQSAVISMGDNAGTPRPILIKDKAGANTYFTISSLSLSTPLAISSLLGISINGGALAATGSIYSSATLGTVIHAATGTIDDIYIANKNGSGVIIIPTGTLNVSFQGAITIASGLTVTSGTSALQAVTATTIVASSSVFAGAGAAVGWTGRGFLVAQSDGVITLLNNAGTDFTRLQFGGTTNAFPALKRNGVNLDVRLADDSGYASLNALNLNFTGDIVGAGTLTMGGQIIGPASTITRATLRVPHGVAPTTPVDGDEWSTTAGRFCRINGVTKQYTLT